MKKTPLLRLALSLLLLAPVVPITPLGSAQNQATAAAPSARVIVKYKPDAVLLRKRALSVNDQHAVQAQTLGARRGIALRSGAAVHERSQVVFASGMSSEQLAAELAQDSEVEFAVPDGRKRAAVAATDPLYLTAAISGPASGQWYLRPNLGAVKSSIDVEPAWDITTGNNNIVVAVLDTGVRFEHPDLKSLVNGGNLLSGYDMINDVDVANDGNLRDADSSDSGDWLTLTEVITPGGPFDQCSNQAENSSWHGTQIAGLIGALTNNGLGMASVGRTVRVLPVRVLGKCGGFDSDIIAGMRWAAGLNVPGVPNNPVANRASVINLSLGGGGACGAAYQSAVDEIIAAGVTIVVSSGNGTGHAVNSPANCVGVIAVSGLRHIGTKVGFSDIGPEVSLSAPGGNCVNPGAGEPCLYPNSDDFELRAHFGCRLDLHRPLQCLVRHQLFRPVGGWLGGPDAVGTTRTDPERSSNHPAVDGPALPDNGRGPRDRGMPRAERNPLNSSVTAPARPAAPECWMPALPCNSSTSAFYRASR